MHAMESPMGVGVYESNFNGTGETFLVDGPLSTDDDYNFYVRNTIATEKGISVDKVVLEKDVNDVLDADFDDPDDYGTLSFEQWAQDDYDDFNRDMIMSVEEAADALGMPISVRDNFRADRANFDGDFVQIAEDDYVEIGWRSWETDFVIGVAPSRQAKEWVEDGAYHTDDIVNETGLTPDEYAEKVANLVSQTASYLRVALSDAGLDLKYKTSGYTTSSYDREDKPEEVLAELKETIQGLRNDTQRSLSEVTSEQRVKLAKALMDTDHRHDIEVMVPIYNKAAGQFILCDPSKDDNPRISAPKAEDVEAYLKTLDDVDGFVPVPVNENTGAWFKALQDKHDFILVTTADEYAQASGEGCVVEMNWDNEAGFREFPFAAAQDGPAPGM